MALSVASVVHGAESSAPDLSKLNLEQLMEIEVTSVSKRPEKLSQAPVAISVITSEDIHHSGARNIPDLLRYEPGLQVARSDAHSWVITARGFGEPFSNKLLVMMDGRTVYTPLFSGVFWDQQDTLLNDIERIEVVRGPGAALWGANAVNGVINIITKSAKDTQGGLVQGGAGSEDLQFGSFRYGGKISENAWYRIYGKYDHHDDSGEAGGISAHDGWQSGLGGFRVDWEPAGQNKVTFQGDVSTAWGGQRLVLPTPTAPFAKVSVEDFDSRSATALARWEHEFSADSTLQVQTYFNYNVRNSVIVREERDTADIDIQHRLALGSRNEFTYGVEYRASHDDIRNSYGLALNPDRKTVQLVSAFVRDELTLVPDRLKLYLGTQVEHNDFTGFEVQPNARLLFTPVERYSFWTSVARAVRTPSRTDQDVRIYQPGPAPGTRASIVGDLDMVSETLMAYEFGIQARPFDRLSLSLATFYNDYDDLRNRALIGFLPGVPPTFAARLENGLTGESYGVELGPTWQVAETWRLQASYTWFKLNLHVMPGHTSVQSLAAEGASPVHQFSLRSAFDLPGNVQFDSGLRYVDQLVSLGVPSYVVMDLRLAWRPAKQWEFSLVGQNLLDRSHPEYVSSFLTATPTEVEHSIYGQITWRF